MSAPRPVAASLEVDRLQVSIDVATTPTGELSWSCELVDGTTGDRRGRIVCDRAIEGTDPDWADLLGQQLVGLLRQWRGSL